MGEVSEEEGVKKCVHKKTDGGGVLISDGPYPLFREGEVRLGSGGRE